MSKIQFLNKQKRDFADYVFSGNLGIENENAADNSVTYKLTLELKNKSAETVWSKSDYIKKFLSN